MEKIPTFLPVVALALIDPEGRILLQQRPQGKHHGGMWEFPGGKLETAEKPREALCREISEELGVALDPMMLTPAGWAEEDAGTPIVLLLYTSRQTPVAVTPHEGQQWGWFARAQAQALELAPMDRRLLANLQL